MKTFRELFKEFINESEDKYPFFSFTVEETESQLKSMAQASKFKTIEDMFAYALKNVLQCEIEDISSHSGKVMITVVGDYGENLPSSSKIEDALENFDIKFLDMKNKEYKK